MRTTYFALAILISVLGLLSMRGGAQSLPEWPQADPAAPGLRVAELFTSQSCSSCPPAESLFAELADRSDLIVLEWHVDYWDRLVHGRSGAWKDPYSNPDWTRRQRQYNRALRGQSGAYTPQAVIDGQFETIGSRRETIEAHLSQAGPLKADIEVLKSSSDLVLKIGSFNPDLIDAAEIYQLTLLPEQRTDVPRGENRGVRLFSRNVVLNATYLGDYDGSAQTLTSSAPEADKACVILIQNRRGNRLGPILGASYC